MTPNQMINLIVRQVIRASIYRSPVGRALLVCGSRSL